MRGPGDAPGAGGGESFLVIQLRQIGDVVLTTPIPRILKEARPASRVTFLTEAPSDRLLAGNPFIDEVLVSRRGGAREALRLARELRRRRFGVVLDFMANPRSALLGRLSGAPERLSYRRRWRRFLYTRTVVPRDGYAVEYKKSLLEALGVSSGWNRPEIFLTADETDRSARWRRELGGPRRVATVDPTHRRPSRRWPPVQFGALCGRLAAELDVLPVVLWGPGEEAEAERVVAESGGAARKAPPTGLREAAALIAAADLHVGNCSAPRHIAVAVGTPTFTIRGSTSSGWTHPSPLHADVALGLPCQPCNRGACDREHACLRDLGADAVFEELRAWAREVLGWGGG